MTETAVSPPSAATETKLVNGVFKGGGAKGIAYAGALKALAERNIWFSSVAGASAGAITASLIAGGMNASDIEQAVPRGLEAMKSSIPARLGKAVIGQATSIFESIKLREWLDSTLAERIGKTDGTPVTFDELFQATRIELYVVAMDLSNGLPVVFCRRTTPHVEVAGAVASSSAIPDAFPPGRGVFKSVSDGTVVHQLVDGGTWANYPSFIFQDKSFRTWLLGQAQAHAQAEGTTWTATDTHEWNAEDARPVVGLILGDPEPADTRHPIGLVPLTQPVNRRFDLGPTYTSPKRATFLFGAILSSDWARLIVGVALTIWVSVSIAVLPIGFRRFSTWLAWWMPDVLFPFALIGSLTVVVLAVVAAVGSVTVLIVAGRLIADTLVPSFTALMGVPTEVAPWIGLGDDAIVLRVPHGTLATTQFKVPDAVRDQAVADARASVLAQLDDPATTARLETLFARTAALDTQQPLPPVPPVSLPTVQAPPPDKFSVDGLITLVAMTALLGLLAWWATNLAGSEGIGLIMGAVVLGLVIGTAGLWYVGGRTGARAAARAMYGLGSATPGGRAAVPIAIGAGVAMIIGGAVLSAVAMDDRNDDTVEAVVIAATEPDDGAGDNRYLMEVDGGDIRFEVSSERHLRLGETAFVEFRDNGTAKLVGTLDDGRFSVSIMLWAFGFGVLTSGLRRRAWIKRCERLETLIATWQP